MQTSNTVLFEIGMEELPARFINEAEQQLREKTSSWLNEERITFQQLITFSTPRRLAIMIKGIAEEQKTIVEKIRGPKIDIAKDEDDNWTKAAIGFSKGQGKTVDDIFIEEIKGISYTFVEKRIEGKKTIQLLSGFKNIIASFAFPQTMRWGDKSFRFARPIRWLIAMMNEEVISFEVAGVKTSNETYGHRFLSSKVSITHPEEYENLLRENFVIANRKKREELIVEQIKRMEKEQRFYIDLTDSLLNEVCNLVEYPTVFYGKYDAEFLILPEEVLITSMREHQRYFPVFTDENKQKLLPYFVSVRNGDATSLENVVQGNEKVLRARLADARFFYNEDRNQSINQYIEKLKTVIFQEELGTVYDKLIRVRKISKKIAALLNISEEETNALDRAASICKFDLVTSMVNEFPELQGVIGEKYALHFNEDDLVASSIKEHYKPLYAKDTLPSSNVAAILSVADKLDTIVGTISIGLIPTGSQDPYGLRRQAIGVLRILLEQRWNIPFEKLITIGQKMFNENEHENELLSFFKDRAIYIFNENDIERDVIRAVMSNEIGIVHYAFEKAKLLSLKRNDPTFKLAQESFVRVLNMANKTKQKTINEQLFQTPSEKQLYRSYMEIKEKIEHTNTQLDAEKTLSKLETLAEPIYQFFEHNMVMDSNEAIRNNRLALINQISETIQQFANLTLVEWKQHN